MSLWKRLDGHSATGTPARPMGSCRCSSLSSSCSSRGTRRNEMCESTRRIIPRSRSTPSLPVVLHEQCRGNWRAPRCCSNKRTPTPRRCRWRCFAGKREAHCATSRWPTGLITDGTVCASPVKWLLLFHLIAVMWNVSLRWPRSWTQKAPT